MAFSPSVSVTAPKGAKTTSKVTKTSSLPKVVKTSVTPIRSMRPNTVTRQIPNSIPVITGSIAPFALEIEKATQDHATEIGTNLYPRTVVDPVNSDFPNDPLATFLGYKAPALANTPLANNDVPIAATLQYVDWVKNTLINNAGPSLVGGVAVGIIPNVSGATFSGQKRGDWNGARMVDTYGNQEQDQFVQGGKEDDVSTWTIAPGSIGSSKFDATQIFIANTSYQTSDTTNFPSGKKDVLYFGMERRGNNGTTCFDFEFNQLPPTGDYIPNRSDGDVLFTFEMNGSGSSGSAVPHIYIYSSSDNKYLTHEITASIPAARRPVSTINMKATPSAPWGYVNSKGTWEVGQVPNFIVAEAAVPFGVDFLQNVQGCGGAAYVQVRTRSSVTVNSDLKDTTKFVQYSFGGPTADLQLQSNCNQTFSYSGAGSVDSAGGTNLTYNWTFVAPAGVTLSSADPEFALDSGTTYKATFTSDAVRNVSVTLPNGTDSAEITAQLKVVEGNNCEDTTDVFTVKVWRQLGAQATLTPACNSLGIDYASTVTGGKPSYTYSWKFFKVGTPDTEVGTSSSASGTFIAPSDGDYYATLKVTDTSDPSSDSHVTGKPVCEVNVQSNTVTVNDAMNPVATKDSADGSALTVTLKVTYHAPANVQWQKLVGATWTDIPGATGDTYTYSTFEADDAAPVATNFTIGSDSYKGKVYSVQFRAVTSRTTNGGCSQNSAAVTVKKVVAVDP